MNRIATDKDNAEKLSSVTFLNLCYAVTTVRFSCRGHLADWACRGGYFSRQRALQLSSPERSGPTSIAADTPRCASGHQGDWLQIPNCQRAYAAVIEILNAAS